MLRGATHSEIKEGETSNDPPRTQEDNALSESDERGTSLSKSESLEDVESKDLDTEKIKKEELEDNNGTAGISEPEEVIFAREEISTLIAEEKRTSDLKADLQEKLQQTRKEVETLEELLPKKISSEENREILGLLCKIHELEITNGRVTIKLFTQRKLVTAKGLGD